VSILELFRNGLGLTLFPQRLTARVLCMSQLILSAAQQRQDHPLLTATMTRVQALQSPALSHVTYDSELDHGDDFASMTNSHVSYSSPVSSSPVHLGPVDECMMQQFMTSTPLPVVHPSPPSSPPSPASNSLFSSPNSPRYSGRSISSPIPPPPSFLDTSHMDIRSPALEPEVLPSHKRKAPQHERYYLKDGTVIFIVSALSVVFAGNFRTQLSQVDSTLFKVHRFFLERDSEKFRQVINEPPAGTDGLTNSTAIPLDGVCKDEFVALLDFFYNGYVNTS
jgi:hypothetical protein